MIAIGIPSLIVRVERNGIFKPGFFDGVCDIFWNFFESKFRSMNADNNKPIIFIRLPPGAKNRLCANTVDAGIGLKIDKNNFSLEIFFCKRSAVGHIKPLSNAKKIRHKIA